MTPLALSEDGETLVRVNPVQNTITVFDLTGNVDPYDIPVGLTSVWIRQQPPAAWSIALDVSLPELTGRNTDA